MSRWLALLLLLAGVAQAQPFLVQEGTPQSSTNTTCVQTVYTFPAITVTADDALTVLITSAADGGHGSFVVSVADDNSGVWLSTNAGYNWYAANHLAGATVVTVTMGNNYACVGQVNIGTIALLQEWGNVNHVTPLDQNTVVNGTSDTILSGTTGTTAQAIEVAIAAGAILHSGAITLSGASGGYTDLTAPGIVGHNNMAAAYKVLSSVGTESTSWTTSSGSVPYSGFIFTLRGFLSDTPTPTPTSVNTPTDTPTPTNTLTFTPTPTGTLVDTFTPTQTGTPTLTGTPTPTPTRTGTPTLTSTPQRIIGPNQCCDCSTVPIIGPNSICSGVCPVACTLLNNAACQVVP